MDFAHLRYFEAIARSGSMTAAARALGVSQPTLTLAMRNFEEKLGTTLFLRERRGVTLTQTGEVLLRHSQTIFAQISEAEREIRGLETDATGSFTIGCYESLGAYFLPGFMADFLPQYPGIELKLWNDNSAEVERAVVARKVDFGLVVNPRGHADVVMVKLFTDAVDFFVADSGNRDPLPPPASQRATPKDPFAEIRPWISDRPLIYPGRVYQCIDMIEELAKLDLYPSRILPCGDFELVKSLALAGIGVALLPRRIAAYGQPGKLRRLHPDLPNYPDVISLLYRADMHRTRAAMTVKDALVRYGKSVA